jgi:type II secretory pathway pseudopilin PulG
MHMPSFLKRFRSAAGFTMIELLVVTTIIIVLTTIGLVSYQQAGQTARNGKRKADLQAIRQALVLFKTDNPDGTYPGGDFDAMMGEISPYLGSPVSTFQDPTGDTYEYTYQNTGTGFILQAQLEPEGDVHEVTNP